LSDQSSSKALPKHYQDLFNASDARSMKRAAFKYVLPAQAGRSAGFEGETALRGASNEKTATQVAVF
jgi:hypothetical protein